LWCLMLGFQTVNQVHESTWLSTWWDQNKLTKCSKTVQLLRYTCGPWPPAAKHLNPGFPRPMSPQVPWFTVPVPIPPDQGKQHAFVEYISTVLFFQKHLPDHYKGIGPTCSFDPALVARAPVKGWPNMST
jgi:hypothetical protein